MFRKAVIITLSIMGFCYASAASAAEPNDYIVPGKSYMLEGTLSGLRLAHETFDLGINDQMCPDCNTNRELIFLHSVTRSAMLFIDNNDVPVDSFLGLAQQFGITLTGDYFLDVDNLIDVNDLVDVNVALDANAYYRIPPEAPNAIEVGEIIHYSIIPEINDIIDELDAISDSPSDRFRIFFEPDQTGLQNNLEVDYGEVLILKGLLLALKGQLEAKLAYDMFVDINEELMYKLLYEDGIDVNDGNVVDLFVILDVNDPNNPNINEEFLNRYPYLLTVLPTPGHEEDGATILAQAAQDWIDAIGYYFNAIDYIRSEDEPSGTDPQEDELLYIDPNDEEVLDNINARLTTLRDSLINDTVGTYPLETSNTYYLEDPCSTITWELTLNYDIVGLPTDEAGSLVVSGSNGTPSPWEVTDISIDGNEIILEMDYDVPGYWGGALFTGILSDDSNSITNGTFTYWGPGYGTIYNLSGQLISTEVVERQLDPNPIFGSSYCYPDPVNPRDILPEFDHKNMLISGTFGHGLGDDPTLGGILPGMTQEEWAILFDLPVPGLRLYERLRLAAGDRPNCVVLGDLNGDGVLDIVTANSGSNDVSVLLGLGDGSFHEQARFGVGHRPESVVLGDVDGDGSLDIVTANTDSDDVSVLLGLGDGSFHEQARFSVGNHPKSVALGDLNGDGILDVVTANCWSADVSVLLGLGDGSFGPQATFGVGSGPSSVALGDLNGDGNLDIVTVDSWSWLSSISVLLGLGDGSFQPQTTFEVGSGPSSVTLGDLNGDGALDIVTANSWSNTISVLLGLGDGSFEMQARFEVGDQPQSLSLGDTNGDGVLDVVTANGWDENISVLLGVGDGGFERSSRFDAGNDPQSVAIGDLNGDGILDIVTANTGPSDVAVFINRSIIFGHWPSGTTVAPVDAIRIRFPHDMNTLTFSLEDDIVSFVGPHGTIDANSYEWLNPKTLEIRFEPQSACGIYELLIGPEILDALGRAMDVDHDSVPGEVPDDRYVATFSLPGHGDLVVTVVDVQGAPMAGRTLHIAWDVLNDDPNNTTGGGFLDAVYLSSDQRWDIGDIHLGTVQHEGTLEPRQSYHAEIDVILPGVVPAEYHILIRTDPANTVEEPNGENNNVTASDPIAVDVQGLTIGVSATESFTSMERARYFRVTVAEGEDLQICLDDLDDTGTNELYASFGLVPTRSHYDYRYPTNFAPDQTVRISGTQAGTYYILAYGGSIPGASPSGFNIKAEYLPMEIYSVDPNKGWNALPIITTVTIDGARFHQGANVLLRRTGETDIIPTETTFVDTGNIVAQFDLSGVPVGSWSLLVVNPDLESAAFPFTIAVGGSGKLETHLVLPSALATNRRAVLWIEYTNTGDAPMLAPLLKFHGSQNALLTADKSMDGPGLRTNNPPAGLSDTVQVLALGSGPDPGVLNPGDSGRIPIYYRGLKQPWDWSRPPIKFDLGILNADDTTPIDWAKVEADMCPCHEDPNIWDEVFLQLQANIGSTWGDYVTALTDNARRRAQYGVITYDVRTLFNDELQQAYGKDQGVIGGHARLADIGGNVANANIIASQVDGNDVAFGTTDINGRFFIGNLAIGLYELIVENYFLDSPVQVEVVASQDPCSVKLVVHPAGEIAGYVRTEDYQWPTNALVTAVSTTGEVFTARTNWGYYQITGLPQGTYTVRCDLEPYVTAEKTNVSVRFGHTTWLSEFVLIVGGTITGTVTDANNGTPVEGAQVVAISDSDLSFGATTDQEGTYSISGLADAEWTLVASTDGYVTSSLEAGSVGPNDVVVGMDFELMKGIAFEGIVVEEDGITPVPHTFILFRRGEENVGIALATQDGIFYYNRLGPGDYLAFVSAPGYADAEVPFQLTTEGLVSPLVILLSPVSEMPGKELSARYLLQGVDPVLLMKELTLRDVAVGFLTVGWENACHLLLHYLGPLGPDADRGIVGGRHFSPSSSLSLEAKQITNCEYPFVRAKQEVEGKIRQGLEKVVCSGNGVGAISGGCNALIFYFPGTQIGVGDPGWSFGCTETGSYRLVGATVTWYDNTCTVDGTVGYTFTDVYQFTECHQSLTLFDRYAYELGVAGWATPFRTSLQIRDTFELTIYCTKEPDPNTKPDGGGSTDNIGSWDPNKKLGPKGFGAGGFIVADPSSLVYTIYFENEPNATAAALEVHIEDQLDTDLDWKTFELLEIGFGPYQVAIPTGVTHYETTKEIDGWTWNAAQGWHTGETPLMVDISADIDISTGEIVWNISSYDPQTGWEPEDAYAGFLPPDDPDNLTHRGEGYVTFLVRSKAGLTTGTQIANTANIFFDANPPISTPTVLHTIDDGSPSSHVSSLPAITTTTDFIVEWTGQDDIGGSGIAHYDIYVSTDGSDYLLWLNNTSDTNAVFTGEPGHTYAYYSIATDNVGNVEDPPLSPDAITTVIVYQLPVAIKNSAIDDLEGAKTGDTIDKEIEKAISYIRKSLDNKKGLWIDDSHLDPKLGKKIFDEEKKAAKKLMQLMGKEGTPEAVKDACLIAIAKLIEADDILARTVYDDALDAAGDPKVDRELEKCEKEFDKVDEELAKENYDKAIDLYKKAWGLAQKVIKYANK